MVNVMASEDKATGAVERTTEPSKEATGAVERTTELSKDVVQALEDSGRYAVKAVGRFLVSVEEALPQLERARGVEKKITDSAVEMVQELIQTQSEFLRKVVDSAGKSLSRPEDES
jgi:hypothetical protein